MIKKEKKELECSSWQEMTRFDDYMNTYII